MTSAPETNVWGTGDELLESRNSLRTRMLDSHVAICFQCMNDFWISTMPSIPFLQDVFPNDRVLMYWDRNSDPTRKQIWVLGGIETDDWNLWDVYDYDYVALHWVGPGNANTEITLRYSFSYWWPGVYESPSQD